MDPMCRERFRKHKSRGLKQNKSLGLKYYKCSCSRRRRKSRRCKMSYGRWEQHGESEFEKKTHFRTLFWMYMFTQHSDLTILWVFFFESLKKCIFFVFNGVIHQGFEILSSTPRLRLMPFKHVLHKLLQRPPGQGTNETLSWLVWWCDDNSDSWWTRWWQLKYFLFSPLFGEDFQFDEHIFQMGWNHQLVNYC